MVAEGQPGPYQLIFTVEGHEQDVAAELRAAHDVTDGKVVDAFSGVDLWEKMLSASQSHLRVGLSPAQVPEFIRRHPVSLGEDFIVDLANGMLYIAPAPLPQVKALRETALCLAGYAVLVNGPQDQGIDPWGYTPDTLPLMRQLKACWDPHGILNPGVFLV